MSEQPDFPCSFLFVPGERHDLLSKATRARPDAVIIDLEDGVAPANKEDARAEMGEAARSIEAEAEGFTTVLVRVNPVDSPWFMADVEAAASSGLGVVLPKGESVHDIEQVRAYAPVAQGGSPILIAGVETAKGVADVHRLADAGPTGLYFGPEDFIADMSGQRTDGGHEVMYARSRVANAARAARIFPIDQAVVDVRDDTAFRTSCEEALAIGFAAKLCLHPRQVELLHEVFDPTPSDVERAREIIEAHRAALDTGTGVCVVGGQMIDAPLVEQARQIERRASRAEARRRML